LADALSDYPEALGPLTLDHGLFDHAVTADEDDDARSRVVFAAIWPNNGYDEDGGAQASRTGRTRFRDALHVATAIRYRGTGL